MLFGLYLELDVLAKAPSRGTFSLPKDGCYPEAFDAKPFNTVQSSWKCLSNIPGSLAYLLTSSPSLAVPRCKMQR